MIKNKNINIKIIFKNILKISFNHFKFLNKFLFYKILETVLKKLF